MSENISEGYPKDNRSLFPVTGAGIVSVSNSASASCGDTVGFSIGVSWGRHGYAGGVISRTEALKLAKHIIEACNACNMTEAEVLGKRTQDIASIIEFPLK